MGKLKAAPDGAALFYVIWHCLIDTANWFYSQFYLFNDLKIYSGHFTVALFFKFISYFLTFVQTIEA